MKFRPHAYQQHCIDKIVELPKLGLFLDMGLGKSVITLTAIRILRYDMFAVRKVLVIAPKKVAEATWTQEAAKWDHTQVLRISKVLGSAKKREQALLQPADIYVTNRENVTWLVDHYREAWPFDMVVIDESSSFKSHKAKRFKSLVSVLPHIRRVVELTGTPSPNGLADLWAQVYLLDQGARLERRFTQFRSRYFDAGLTVQGVVYNYKAKFGSRETILQKISDICISMKAEDYLQLPDLIYDDIPVAMDPKAEKAYAELEKQMVLELDEEDITVTSAAALSNKLLQLSNGAVYDMDHNWHAVHDCKLDALVELVQTLKERGKPALVFYQFVSDRERILQALNEVSSPPVLAVTMDGNDEIDAWNAGEIDVLLAHPASAAYGLNLQEGGNHVIWFGLTWNYEQYVQANARLHRQGQTEKVIVHHLVCTGTRDDDVMTALKNKDASQQYVMESLKARIRKIKANNGLVKANNGSVKAAGSTGKTSGKGGR